MTTVTVELLRDDAFELIQQLENLSILRVTDRTTQKKPEIRIADLKGKMNLGLSIEDIDKQLKSLRDEWERDI